MRAKAQPLLLRLALAKVRRALAQEQPPARLGPLVVAGFFNETKGISEAARLTARALDVAGFFFESIDLRELLEPRQGVKGRSLAAGEGGVLLIHANAPEALIALARQDPSGWLGRYRIGYWAYELPIAPRLWSATSIAFHEIWVPSRFVADALSAAGVETPIRVMPHPVAMGGPMPGAARPSFGIPADAFTVLAIGDLRSSATRKNLLGAIDIYRRAFPTPNGQSALVVKIQSGEVHPAFREHAEKATNKREDVIFIPETLAQLKVKSLIASCDLLLSPHRSEGFGLTLAEAFMAGVPALATGWSGNLDFMSKLSELLIDSKLVSVRDVYGIYRSDRLQWAEPDLADAARKLSALASDPGLRSKLASRGRAAVEQLSAAWSRAELNTTPLGELVSR